MVVKAYTRIGEYARNEPVAKHALTITLLVPYLSPSKLLGQDDK